VVVPVLLDHRIADGVNCAEQLAGYGVLFVVTSDRAPFEPDRALQAQPDFGMEAETDKPVLGEGFAAAPTVGWCSTT